MNSAKTKLTTPIYYKTNPAAELPDDDPVCYVLARNGLYVRRKHPFFTQYAINQCRFTNIGFANYSNTNTLGFIFFIFASRFLIQQRLNHGFNTMIIRSTDGYRISHSQCMEFRQHNIYI